MSSSTAGPAALAAFSQAPDDELLRHRLEACCAAPSWVQDLVAGRPYPDVGALEAASDRATATLSGADFEQALAAHPRIGERAAHGRWSAQEQSGVAGADDDLRDRLRQANIDYEQRFGHVYLVCATGRSAQEMLDLALERLHNDPAAEHGVVLSELAAINRLRLAKMLQLYTLED